MPAKQKMQAAAWQKSPPELVARLEALIKNAPGAERRVMFGFPCAFFQGNMFTGVFQEHVFFRLAPADRQEFLALPGAAPFEPVKGRVMREYVTVPQSMLADDTQLQAWLVRSLGYARALPVKEKKVRTKK